MPAATRAITVGTVGQYCLLNAAPAVGDGITIDPTGQGAAVNTGGNFVDAVTDQGNGTYLVLLGGVRSYATLVPAGTAVMGSYTRDGTHPNANMHKLMAVPVAAFADTLAAGVA